MKNKIILTILLIFMAFSVFGCGENDKYRLEKDIRESINQKQEEVNKEEELPEISQKAKNITVEEIEKHELIKDAYIKIEEDQIVLALQVNYSINEETAKELGENFARLLASMSASFNDKFKYPTKDNLGSIYDYYDLQIVVGTGTENIIIHGAKAKIAKNINW